MQLNSLALRGRSLEQIKDLPASLRPLASKAIESAHCILQFVLEEPSIRDSLVGVPLYLHSMIAFAVVFLIKMSRRWHCLGVTIDPVTTTRPLVEGIITALRQCRAGSNHILYSMATGFERLLKCSLTSTSWKGNDDASTSQARANEGVDQHYQAPAGQQQEKFLQHSDHVHEHQAINAPGVSANDFTVSPSSGMLSGSWQSDDDALWNLDMGYDLLASAADSNEFYFPFQQTGYSSFQ